MSNREDHTHSPAHRLNPFEEVTLFPEQWDLSSLPSPGIKPLGEDGDLEESGSERHLPREWEHYFDPAPRPANWDLSAF